MSDTAITFAVVPILITLTLAMEGVRIGCARLRYRRRLARSTSRSVPAGTQI